MKISKHTHSCLLIEEQEKVILTDPGNYTFEENALDVEKLQKLDFILITHEHQDHMNVPLIKKLLEKFPNVQIISNNSVAQIFKKENIQVSFDGNEFIHVQDAPHEPILGPTPPNVLFRIFNKLTHPGDSFQFDATTEILALPIQAPWGSMVQAVELAVKLKPKVVIPIHDWHWREEARERFYGMARQYLQERGIEFKALTLGEIFEV